MFEPGWSPVSDQRRMHWEQVYRRRPAQEMSWFQAEPVRSLALIRRAGIDRADPVVDIGGGASVLVDRLLEDGFADLTVVDLAESALDHVRRRLGDEARRVTLIAADATCFRPDRRYALWHDRAVFHFLTDSADRAAYADCLCECVRPDGHVIIATFAPDGPPRCSGLEVTRYDVDALAGALGSRFRVIEAEREVHQTPAGVRQPFLYARFQVV